ncbi:hydrogenase nickel incorporation protein HypB [Paraburkholderia fungorum]|uniref:hydrogenase nickel incorporation protein HypB n=1 Tax=Paraburkholderia fungorum TaxID=134537 RepID=UPI0038BC531C
MCTTCGCSNTRPAAVTDLDAVKPEEDDGRSQSQSQLPSNREAGAVGSSETAYRRVDDRLHASLIAHTEGHSHSHMHSRHESGGHAHHHVHWHDGDHAHSHTHEHDHDDGHVQQHDHDHDHDHGRSIDLERAILAKNQLLAERNRGWLAGRSIFALNLMSSPGAGKTTLLERTIRDLGSTFPLTVIEGDQATLNDAERIRAIGARVVQVNTGAGCHLDAEMASRALTELDPPLHSVVMIENVGNLVCPALFDLGEAEKVLILSVTEGEDKPIKYPHMFQACSLLLLNKIDLLPHLRFDVDRCIRYAKRVNPEMLILQVSAQSGEGIEAWYGWLRERAPSRGE